MEKNYLRANNYAQKNNMKPIGKTQGGQSLNKLDLEIFRKKIYGKDKFEKR